MTSYPSLDTLHRDLNECRLCAEAGHLIESLPIFSGPQSARLFLIGQAPGIQEGESRRPFSGPSGKKLFAWLAEAGWDEDDFRARCYISAVTKCFPGKHPTGRGDRVPSPVERKLCRSWLDGELGLVNPELVVPVGKIAISLFYDRSGSCLTGFACTRNNEVLALLAQRSQNWAVSNEPTERVALHKFSCLEEVVKTILD